MGIFYNGHLRLTEAQGNLENPLNFTFLILNILFYDPLEEDKEEDMRSLQN